jgi:DNA adenine methylase
VSARNIPESNIAPGQKDERGQTCGEPFLKWAGGKRRLLDHILPLMPESAGRYYEPFLGGGAVFFAYHPRAAVLSDVNPELMNCYCQVKRRPKAIIEGLRALKNNKAAYYSVRRSSPKDKLARAVRTTYLTNLSFNGIYRQNLSGVFNVPYGYKTSRDIHDSAPIIAASRALRSARLRCADFEKATADAQEGDVVYLDPPYTVAHTNNGFVKYNAKIFSWADQQRLAGVAVRLARKGCSVIVSNADHPSIHALYPGFEMARVERFSVVAAGSPHRRRISECLFYWQRR